MTTVATGPAARGRKSSKALIQEARREAAEAAREESLVQEGVRGRAGGHPGVCICGRRALPSPLRPDAAGVQRRWCDRCGCVLPHETAGVGK